MVKHFQVMAVYPPLRWAANPLDVTALSMKKLILMSNLMVWKEAKVVFTLSKMSIGHVFFLRRY